jgi:DNA-binding transcriptional LysR family regulator
MNQLLAMRAFLRVVETGTFGHAADQLGVPRSTVSKLIADLEAHLGVQLMHRTTRRLSVTAEGQEYYQSAARLVVELDAADGAVRGRKLKPRGHVRIDAPTSFANCLLIPALPDFHQQYPDVTLAIGIDDRPVNIVGEGVDCAIRAGELRDLGLVARRIAEFGYVTCASPAYLNRKGIPGSPADLTQGHALIGHFSAATGKLRPLLFERDGERHEAGDCAFSVNNGDGLTRLLLAGLGIGQHLRPFVQRSLDAGELVEILPDWTRPAAAFHAVYPPNRHPSARLRAVLDWLASRFG